MADPSNPPTTSDSSRRAEVVAAIRALADLIESNPAVPVPNIVSAQHSILGDLTDEGVALVRATAAALGVEPDINENPDHNLEVTRRAAASTVIGRGYSPEQGSFWVTYTILGLTRRPAGGAE